MLPVLNEMGFDAMTAHWEFAYGPENFIKLSEKLNYPVLAVNCYYKGTDKRVFKPYRILDVGDLQLV